MKFNREPQNVDRGMRRQVSLRRLFVVTAIIAALCGWWFRPQVEPVTAKLYVGVPYSSSIGQADSEFETEIQAKFRSQKIIDAAVNNLKRRGEQGDVISGDPQKWYEDHLQVNASGPSRTVVLTMVGQGYTQRRVDLGIALDAIIDAFCGNESVDLLNQLHAEPLATMTTSRGRARKRKTVDSPFQVRVVRPVSVKIPKAP